MRIGQQPPLLLFCLASCSQATGLGILFDETTRDSEQDFTRLDAIVLPIALIILGKRALPPLCVLSFLPLHMRLRTRCSSTCDADRLRHPSDAMRASWNAKLNLALFFSLFSLCAGYVVRSWRLMLIALMNVLLSLLVSFLIMWPVRRLSDLCAEFSFLLLTAYPCPDHPNSAGAADPAILCRV
jgi:hypothetical protein